MAAYLLLFFLFFCGGCSRQAGTLSSTTHRVVTQINISYENGPIRTQRHYSSNEKMQTILNYLRLLNPYGVTPTPPSCVSGSNFDIVLTYSDGGEKHYRQHADRYWQEGEGSWKEIDPKKALQLSRILCQMESDEI